MDLVELNRIEGTIRTALTSYAQARNHTEIMNVLGTIHAMLNAALDLHLGDTIHGFLLGQKLQGLLPYLAQQIDADHLDQQYRRCIVGASNMEASGEYELAASFVDLVIAAWYDLFGSYPPPVTHPKPPQQAAAVPVQDTDGLVWSDEYQTFMQAGPAWEAAPAANEHPAAVSLAGFLDGYIPRAVTNPAPAAETMAHRPQSVRTQAEGARHAVKDTDGAETDEPWFLADTAAPAQEEQPWYLPVPAGQADPQAGPNLWSRNDEGIVPPESRPGFPFAAEPEDLESGERTADAAWPADDTDVPAPEAGVVEGRGRQPAPARRLSLARLWRPTLGSLVPLLPIPFLTGVTAALWHGPAATPWTLPLMICLTLLTTVALYHIGSLLRMLLSLRPIVTTSATLVAAVMMVGPAFMHFDTGPGTQPSAVERSVSAIYLTTTGVSNAAYVRGEIVGHNLVLAAVTAASVEPVLPAATPDPATPRSKPQAATLTTLPTATVPAGLRVGGHAQVKTQGAALLCRAGPGTDQAILNRFKNGTTLLVVGGPVASDSFTWWQVQSEGQIGWSAADYLVPVAP